MPLWQPRLVDFCHGNSDGFSWAIFHEVYDVKPFFYFRDKSIAASARKNGGKGVLKNRLVHRMIMH